MENNEILTEVAEAEAESADTQEMQATQETTKTQDDKKQEKETNPFGCCLTFFLIAIPVGFLAVMLMGLLIVMSM